MGVFLLVLCILLYYCALFLLIKCTFKALHIKRWIPLFVGSFILFSIPMFCIIDYIHRGNAFVEAFVIPGYIIMAFLIYYLLSQLIILVIRWIITMLKKRKMIWLDKLSFVLASISSVVICCVGIACAQLPEVTHHSFDFGIGEEMRIVVVSDMHYGSTGSMLSLQTMVDHINAENPDVVFLVGDVFDNSTSNINHQEFVDELNRLNTRFGTFAVTGNHEFMLNDIASIQKFYEGTNIKLLLDEEVIINQKIRLAGRIDHRVPRKDLVDIVSDSTLPLIVLDHQPQFFRDAESVNARLQISGHTHNGQIFPGNFFIFLMNKILYDSPSNGLHNYDDFSLAITRGYGTWGFPMRLTGASQIMVFTLK